MKLIPNVSETVSTSITRVDVMSDHIPMTEPEIVSETLDINSILTQLIARKDFIPLLAAIFRFLGANQIFLINRKIFNSMPL
jgi:hypothetical protein